MFLKRFACSIDWQNECRKCACHDGFFCYVWKPAFSFFFFIRVIIEGDVARRTGSNCLRFYYSMNGFHIGTLLVYTRVNNGNREKKWGLSGDQLTGWKRAGVELDMEGVTEVRDFTTSSHLSLEIIKAYCFNFKYPIIHTHENKIIIIHLHAYKVTLKQYHSPEGGGVLGPKTGTYM